MANANTNGHRGKEALGIEWTPEQAREIQDASRFSQATNGHKFCPDICSVNWLCRQTALDEELPCELSDIDAGIDPFKPSGQGNYEEFTCVECGERHYRSTANKKPRLGFCKRCAALYREEKKRWAKKELSR